MKNKSIIRGCNMLVFLIFSLGMFLIGRYYGKTYKGWPFIKKNTIWSIGIYEGNSISNLHPSPNVSNPVLTAKDVTDVPAEFIADPFMIEHNGKWYMFFEAMNSKTKQGDIGLAISDDCLHWEYKQIVLDEPFHMSYPYVFKWQDEFYMIPETASIYAIRLYKATEFPIKWVFYKKLIYGHYCDSSIVQYRGKWWLFACEEPLWDTLHLFYSDDLNGPWVDHPQSPVIRNNRDIARPGGRVLVYKDRVIRFGQDCRGAYGSKLRAFEITKLSEEDYEEREMLDRPVIAGSGNGWNAAGMHQLDLHQIGERRYIGCVDGYRTKLSFDLKICRQ